MPIVGSQNDMIIVAHPDDDLAFMNPDIADSIAAGRAVTTVYLTAGDAGQGPSYWAGREDGVKAAYAFMAGGGDWVDETVTLYLQGSAVQVASSYLASDPDIRLYFLRLPDGGGEAAGRSLDALIRGDVASLTTVDVATQHTAQSVVETVSKLMERHQPDQLRIHDNDSIFAAGEHIDHLATAQITQDALASYSRPTFAVTSYVHYGSADLRQNLSAEDALISREAFLRYAAFDPDVTEAEGYPTALYEQWVLRQYVAKEVIVDNASTAAVTGRYFSESQNQGQETADDLPVAGAVVSLVDVSIGQAVATTSTDLDGTYGFYAVPAGAAYQLRFQPSADLAGPYISYGFATAHAGGDARVDSDVITAQGLTEVFTVTPGSQLADVDAAIYDANPASISGQVFIDANVNHQRDNGEASVAGYQVALWSEAGDQIVATTTTDASGTYVFDSIAPNVSYRVLFEAPASTAAWGDHLFVPNDPEAGASINSDIAQQWVDGRGASPSLLIVVGQDVANIDAGLQAPTVASLSGRYFIDANGDGVEQNAEAGVSEADVFLMKNGVQVQSTVTDDAGLYTFQNVTPGSEYEVWFEAPADLGGTLADLIFADAFVGGDASIDSDVSRVAESGAGRVTGVSIAARETVTQVDAGLTDPPPAQISGRYFSDSDGNGAADGGFGVVGASVWLYQGEVQIGATTTDVFGAYHFSDIRPGDNYTVRFERPESFRSKGAPSEFAQFYASEVAFAALNSDVVGVDAAGRGTTVDFRLIANAHLQDMDAGIVGEDSLRAEDGMWL